MSKILVFLSSLIFIATARAQVPGDLPWAPGDCNGTDIILRDGILTMTCGASLSYPIANQYTFGIADVESETYSATLIAPPMWHHPDWILNQIGNVQGIAIDDLGNIYLTASAHNSPAWDEFPSPGWRYGDIGGGADSLAAAGTVYKIDAITGAPTVFAQLPQQSTTITTNVSWRNGVEMTRTTGPGLFGIAYDPDNDQFYVANIEDGKIYIVESDGSYDSALAFDPLVADTGAAGPAPMGERVMGVEYGNGRVYYSIRDDGANNTIVRSVAINASGQFDTSAGSDVLEIDAELAHTTSTTFIPVVTDLELAIDGKLAVGSASFYGPNPFSQTNHNSGNSVWTENAGIWTQTKAYDPSQVGGTPESYGGVDWDDYNGDGDMDAILWSSSADMLNSSSTGTDEHGVIAYPYSALPNSPTVSGGTNFIGFEYDPAFGDFKGIGNDVELFHGCPVIPMLGVGNLVFADVNGDGDYDAGVDTPIEGVTVQLFNVGETPGVDPPITTSTTGTAGCYHLGTDTAGQYFVHIPAAEFAAGAELEFYLSVPGAGGDDSSDDDSDENGIDDANYPSNGISSATITLAFDGEPLDAAETGKDGSGDTPDDDFDYTVDFGFIAARDYGDAPDVAAGTSDSPKDYQTRDADGGPYHELSAIMLGAVVDAEDGTLQGTAANADDAAGSPDDEDGVTFPSALSTLSSSYSATVAITNPTPTSSSVVEDNFDTGWAGGTGWSDASWTQVGTTSQSNDGACFDGATSYIERAFAVPSGVTSVLLNFHADPQGTVDFNVLVDGSTVTNVVAAGAYNSIDLTSFVTPGSNATLRFAGTLAGTLDCVDNIVINIESDDPKPTVNLVGWIDFDCSGTFDLDEAATLSGQVDGSQTLTWASVPGDILGGTTYARFRLSTDSLTANDPIGAASDGEVEDYLITVTCPTITISPNSLPDGVVGTPYSQALSATGGTAPYTYVVSIGSLPAGLTLTGNTISGTPTSDAGGSFAITTTDAAGCPGSKFFKIEVACPAITVSPSSLPGGTVGTAYSEQLSATGASAPYSYAVTSGVLPAGLTLTGDTISGTPTAPVSENFTITATDTYGCPGAASFTIGIDCNTLVITPTTLADAVYGSSYGPVNFSAAGATGAVTWSVTSGSLPAGMTLSAAGVLSGTPTAGGTFNVGITATDANVCSGSVNLSIDVPIASISGMVYEDTDGDGDSDITIDSVTLSLCDDLGNPVDDPNIAGVQDYVVTTVSGGYLFENIAPGSYVVKETQPAGLMTVTDEDSTADAAGSPADPANTSTTDNEIPVNVGAGELDSGNDFIEVAEVGIGNLVFEDTDGDGVYTSGVDAPIEDVSVQLFAAGDDPTKDPALASVVTDANGCYELIAPAIGDYFVYIPAAEFDAADDGDGDSGELFEMTSVPGVGGDDANDDDADENGIDTPDPTATGIRSVDVNLALGGEPLDAVEVGKDGAGDSQDEDFDYTIDFGFVSALDSVGLGNLVFQDDDSDGDFDAATESGIDGVRVELYEAGDIPGNDDPIASATTASGGCYYFGGLQGGDYVVHIPESEFASGGILNGKISSTGAGGDDQIDDDGGENGLDNSAPDSGGVSSAGITLGVGLEPTAESGKDGAFDTGVDDDNDLSVDFGFHDKPATDLGIGNLVFIDDDGDGIFDPSSESGIDGIAVELYLASAPPGSGSPIASTVTAMGGCYFFGGLPAEDYIVHIPSSVLAFGGPLQGKYSSTGTDGDSGTDDDGGENGLDAPAPGTTGVSSGPITLNGSEPLGDGSTGAESGKSGDGDDADDASNDLTVDFGFTAPAGLGIGNLVFIDSNADGDFDSGVDSGIDGVIVELYNTGDDPATDPPVATMLSHGGGCYYFGALSEGNYFVHIPASEFSGSGPLADHISSPGYGGDAVADDDVDEAGVDSADPATTGISTQTVVLNENSEPSGSGSVGLETGKDGGSDNGLDDDNSDLTVDLGFVAVSGTVGIGNLLFEDINGDGDFDAGSESGIDGVIVELYTADLTPGVDSPVATTTTHSGGCYLFTGLAENDYVVHVPAGEFSSSGPLAGMTSSTGNGGDDATDDGADENGIDPGDETVDGVSTGAIGLLAGTEPTATSGETGKDASADDGSDADIDLTVDLGFVGKPGDFASWQNNNPLGGANAPSDNPDGDVYSNALEYALCLHPDAGTSETVPGGSGGFCIALNDVNGNVEAFFQRPLGGLSDVTYTLEVATAPGSPTAWSAWTGPAPTITDNGDGTEEVRYSDLESNVGSTGLARLSVSVTGDGSSPHPTQVFGWDTEVFPNGCATCSQAYANHGVFSGTATNGDYAAGALDVSSAGGDIEAQFAANAEYYLEIIGGTYEGHRIDVDEASSTAASLSLDTASPRNTLDPVPADLQGQYQVRAHITLDDVVDPTLAVPTADSATGDRTLFFNGNSWDTLWVTELQGFFPKQWTDAADPTLSNQGGRVIDPCEGFFLHPKGGNIEIVRVGLVRSWDFACPLVVGNNLVGGGWPIDMSPSTRAMKRDDGDGVEDWFTGSNDPVQADQILQWVGDAVVGSQGYDSYFRLYLGLPGVYDHWTDQSNSSLASAETNMMFVSGRSLFIKSINGHDKSIAADVWVWPVPWAP